MTEIWLFPNDLCLAIARKNRLVSVKMRQGKIYHNPQKKAPPARMSPEMPFLYSPQTPHTIPFTVSPVRVAKNITNAR